MDSPLYDQFLAIVRAGDEETAREFVAKHMNEFSEATKIAIMGGVLAETLGGLADGAERLATAHEDAMIALDNIESLELASQ